MRRHLALYVLAGTLGVCSGYGQEPSKKDAPKPATATGQKSSPAKVIVLVDDSDVNLPADIHEYQVEIRDIPLSKLLATVKASSSGPIALKGDVGEMRTGHVLLDGKGLAHLVESLPDMVDGLEVKKSTPAQGGLIIVSRAKTGPEGFNALVASRNERQVIPVNFSAYLGSSKDDSKDRKINDLNEYMELAFAMKAKGDGKKVGKVEIMFHGATELGFLSGTPQDLAFAAMALQALGIKMPAVSTNTNWVDLTGTGWMAPATVNSGSRLGIAHGYRDPMVSEGRIMNPSITTVTGQPLPGTNKLVITQEIQDALKKNQEQIAALEGTIRRLEQELDAAKKGAKK